MRDTIPRTAVLLTFGSATLIWFALSVALGLMAPQSGASPLFRLALAVGAALMAGGLFLAARQLTWWALEARARARAVPVRVPVRRRRVRS